MPISGQARVARAFGVPIRLLITARAHRRFYGFMIMCRARGAAAGVGRRGRRRGGSRLPISVSLFSVSVQDHKEVSGRMRCAKLKISMTNRVARVSATLSYNRIRGAPAAPVAARLGPARAALPRASTRLAPSAVRVSRRLRGLSRKVTLPIARWRAAAPRNHAPTAIQRLCALSAFPRPRAPTKQATAHRSEVPQPTQ